MMAKIRRVRSFFGVEGGGGGGHFKLEADPMSAVLKIYISVQYGRCTLLLLRKENIFLCT